MSTMPELTDEEQYRRNADSLIKARTEQLRAALICIHEVNLSLDGGDITRAKTVLNEFNAKLALGLK